LSYSGVYASAKGSSARRRAAWGTSMILLFTDFGLEGPYIGQVKAALWREAPGTPVFDLFSDAPVFSPKSSAYLLAAYTAAFPKDSIFLAVVESVGGVTPAGPRLPRQSSCALPERSPALTASRQRCIAFTTAVR